MWERQMQNKDIKNKKRKKDDFYHFKCIYNLSGEFFTVYRKESFFFHFLIKHAYI